MDHIRFLPHRDVGLGGAEEWLELVIGKPDLSQVCYEVREQADVCQTILVDIELLVSRLEFSQCLHAGKGERIVHRPGNIPIPLRVFLGEVGVVSLGARLDAQLRIPKPGTRFH